jgi:hypothetical protein
MIQEPVEAEINSSIGIVSRVHIGLLVRKSLDAILGDSEERPPPNLVDLFVAGLPIVRPPPRRLTRAYGHVRRGVGRDTAN